MKKFGVVVVREFCIIIITKKELITFLVYHEKVLLQAIILYLLPIFLINKCRYPLKRLLAEISARKGFACRVFAQQSLVF